jgi:hypothetical protein
VKITRFAETAKTFVICNGYHPVEVQVGVAMDPSPDYWRTGDFDRSLLEIAVDRNNGQVANVDLVVPGCHFRRLDRNSPQRIARQNIDGVPVADRSAWSDDQIRVDVPQPIYPTLYLDALVVVFGKPELPDSMLAHSDRLKWYIDAQWVLQGFSVHELTQQEHANIFLGTRD